MPALCILCGKNPSIKGSHIVSKFVVRRLKQGNPIGTLVHSDNVNRTFQDGWKRAYLCEVCEGQFSKYEDWFCRKVYDPMTEGTLREIDYSAELGLFAASLAFRYLWYALETDFHKSPSLGLLDLEKDLREALKADNLAQLKARSYIQFLAPVETGNQFPPGINSYLFEAIDGKVFEYGLRTIAGEPREQFWVIYVKLPGVFFLTSLLDRNQITCGFGEKLLHRILETGNLKTANHTGNENQMVNDIFIQRTFEIQADYEKMSPGRLERNREKIENTPDLEGYRAHQTHLLDVKLMQELASKQVQTPPVDKTDPRGGVN